MVFRMSVTKFDYIQTAAPYKEEFSEQTSELKISDVVQMAEPVIESNGLQVAISKARTKVEATKA
jgi:hypothetical protein